MATRKGKPSGPEGETTSNGVRVRAMVALLAAMMTACHGRDDPSSQPWGKLAAVEQFEVTYDRPQARIPLEPGHRGRLAFSGCKDESAVVERDGLVRFEWAPESGLERTVCVELSGYDAEGKHVDLGQRKYLFKIAPKPGYSPDDELAKINATAQDMKRRLAALTGAINRGEHGEESCPAEMSGWVPVAPLSALEPDPSPKSRAQADTDTVWDNAFAWLQDPSTVTDEGTVLAAAQRRYVAIVAQGPLSWPRWVPPDSFAEGAGAASLYVGDLHTEKILCHALVEFRSSPEVGVLKNIENHWESERATDALASDFRERAQAAARDALGRVAPGLEMLDWIGSGITREHFTQ